ncbi:Glycosyl transferases group 1 [Algoriella xinjiangensis]|uniref:Glycosyl transferases group 1 n=1 Tax=Algoriella xinjiangensis TaxID=684065 RepID=A0A1I4VEJ6_9FLAO|nr:glycosyltransferase [Algoriella xinjiangensis]SFM99654.1 Glycosyl transferases group 1 [Algoriella xinjiangensis]
MKHKILFLSYTDQGGAGIANVNVAKAFIERGHEVLFLVAKKTSTEMFIKEVNKKKIITQKKTFFDKIKNRFKYEITRNFKKKTVEANYVSKYYYYNEDETFSQYSLDEILSHITFQPNIIIAGWISYFINLETLGKLASRYHAQSYILMNDMAPITGGCHYAWDCLGYISGCNSCPALGNRTDQNQSFQNLELKRKSIQKYNIQVIAGSKGTLIEAKQSTLYKDQKTFKRINGLLNYNLFNTKKRHIAKQVFEFPEDHKVILTGASYIRDPRKGFDKLSDALVFLDSMLVSKKVFVTLVMVGNDNYYDFQFNNINVIKYNSISEKILFSLLYQSADVYVSPSVEDSGPAMVIEALASGTPVVGFEIGFVEEYVKNGENGFIIPKFDKKQMAERIFDVLYKFPQQKMQEKATESVEKAFSLQQIDDFFD